MTKTYFPVKITTEASLHKKGNNTIQHKTKAVLIKECNLNAHRLFMQLSYPKDCLQPECVLCIEKYCVKGFVDLSKTKPNS